MRRSRRRERPPLRLGECLGKDDRGVWGGADQSWDAQLVESSIDQASGAEPPTGVPFGAEPPCPFSSVTAMTSPGPAA